MADVDDDPKIQAEFRAAMARIERQQAPDLAALRRICEAIGYGRVMQATEAMWRERLTLEGLAGGEHTCGPCRSTLDRVGVRDSLELLLAWETLPEATRAAALAEVRRG